MKATIFRPKKDQTGIAVSAMTLNEVFDKIRNNLDNKDLREYRGMFLAYEKPEESDVFKRIPRVCPGAYFIRKKNGKKELQAYNGVVVLTITGVRNQLESDDLKRKVMQLPQTFATFMGADGHSVVVLAKVTLPDSKLSETADSALLFGSSGIWRDEYFLFSQRSKCRMNKSFRCFRRFILLTLMRSRLGFC